MINVEKLVGSKRINGAVVAQCPACAANNHDLNGKNHLSVLQNGTFNCVVDGSPEHRQIILKLVGLNPDEIDVEIKFEYKQPIPQVEKVYPEKILNELVKDYSFYTDKGIKEKILEGLRAGVALKGNMNGRFVFPIYTPDGRIHGFSGRTLINSQIRWKHIGVKSNWVYPAKFVDEDITREKYIILVESIGDLIALMSAGIYNVMVLFGVNLHGKLLSYLIAKNPNKIIIATNNDTKHQVGQNAAERIANKLSNYFSSEKIDIKLPTKKDFGDMTEEEIKLWRKELC